MAQEILPSDRAVHSDFLIHWTGKDIDSEEDPAWFGREHISRTSGAATDRYLARLRNILKFGLWMTEEDVPQTFSIEGARVTIPPAPQVCFTELKLSESRRHASRYGRLGIGVKRPFLFNRFGRPMTYFGYSPDSHRDRFLEVHQGGLRQGGIPLEPPRTRLCPSLIREGKDLFRIRAQILPATVLPGSKLS